MAERLDARRVPQVEAEDLQPVAPLLEVRLPRVAGGGVAREAGGDDQGGSRAEQLDPGLVADLHPSAREERHPAGEVRRLRALHEVEVSARRAELVVEVVHLRELRLADVAVPGIVDVLALGVRLAGPEVVRLEVVRRDVLRWEDVGGREHGLRPEPADAGLGEHRLVPRQLVGPLPPLTGPDPLPTELDIGAEHVARRVEQLDPLLLAEDREHRRVGGDGSEPVRERAELVGAVLVARLSGHGARKDGTRASRDTHALIVTDARAPNVTPRCLGWRSDAPRAVSARFCQFTT